LRCQFGWSLAVIPTCADGRPAFVKRKPHGKPVTWTPAKDRLLGTMSDVDVARRLRCSPMAVFYRRRKLKIQSSQGRV